jgi:hypothetical protein
MHEQHWVAIEVGCTECKQDTKVIGVYRDIDKAMEEAEERYDAHHDEHGGNVCSQYNTEVHLLPKVK